MAGWIKLEHVQSWVITHVYDALYRHLVIGGRRGHIATIDWAAKKLGCEVNVRETIRDVQ